eukprot:CAMPEP_0196571036 /NCGR_PEP_ID=MMETSP1081-20130531/1220_1 /TAXON_ID=36882 /ORGANISM="Pyramimonas amylifera, Strain CCMP720" /LENGTH=244 /DNA_ID=CAMNT_0041887795 /DNA_START=260 /DNA_END=994 /DNA_ORIENTATION=+
MKVHIEPVSKNVITVTSVDSNSEASNLPCRQKSLEGSQENSKKTNRRTRQSSVVTHTERLRSEVHPKEAPSLAEMVQKLTEEQIAEFKECFEMFDEDGSGTVDQKELGDILAAMGQKLNGKELTKMVAKVDLDMSGSVDFPEFCALMAWQMYSSGEELQLRKIFDICDEFGEGLVPKTSIRYIISNLVPDISSNDMNEMMVSAPGDYLNFTQFHAIFQESEPNDTDVHTLKGFETKSFKMSDSS